MVIFGATFFLDEKNSRKSSVQQKTREFQREKWIGKQ